MGTIGETITAARERAGLTGTDLARRLRMSQSLLWRREKGLVRTPTDVIEEVVKALDIPFHVTEDGWSLDGWIPSAAVEDPVPGGLVDTDRMEADEARTGREKGPRLKPPIDEDIYLPIAAAAGAGPGQEYDELADKMTTAALNWYHKADTLIRINGTSMEPVFYDSDVIGVQFCTEREVKEGHLVVARWRQYGTTIVKVNRGEMEGRRYLQSLNPTSDIVLGERDELEIIGKPFGLLRTKAIERSY